MSIVHDTGEAAPAARPRRAGRQRVPVALLVPAGLGDKVGDYAALALLD